MSLKGNSNEEKIWNYLKEQGLSNCGAAGLMGNIFAESGLNPINLQNSYEKKLGFTDETYTKAVDSEKYDNFVKDKAGYGLCQWTYWSRKKNMLDFAKKQKKSIGDLEMQLDFLFKELNTSTYKSLLNKLKSSDSLLESSNLVLTKFERPADQSEAVQKKRISYGQKYLDMFTSVKKPVRENKVEPKKEEVKVEDAKSKDVSLRGTYKTTASLNLRLGAGTDKKSLIVLPKGTKVNNYGYFTEVKGITWLYVAVTYDGKNYTGYCSKAYLSKI